MRHVSPLPGARDRSSARPRILCLSSFYSTDRILLHSTFLPDIERDVDACVWSNATDEPRLRAAAGRASGFSPFGTDAALPGWLTLFRHLVDHVWDHTLDHASRTSFWQLKRRDAARKRERVLHALARPASWLRAGGGLERLLQSAVLHHSRSSSAVEAIQREAPSVVLAMTPFWPPQMAIVGAARALGIPVVAFITSWDNLTTKTRLVFDYDAYVVWSDTMRDELHALYPRSRTRPVFVVGAPQYDVFFLPRFRQSRAEFAQEHGLNPARPLILYCLGSPNLIREDHGALQFLSHLQAQRELDRLQVIVRTHPGFHQRGYTQLDRIRERFPGVVIQSAQQSWTYMPFQDERSIREWVNTVRHADVVVNLSSTMTVDAAICDRPVVNLDFDPEPGAPNGALVHAVNHAWEHFQPIAESGGVWLAKDVDDIRRAVMTYLADPSRDRAARRWIVERVAGPTDGCAGVRMARDLRSLVASQLQGVAPLRCESPTSRPLRGSLARGGVV